MHSKKRLIVNADDFGLDTSVNLGIIGAHRKGVVTSASLLVCVDGFDDAVRLAKENNTLGVGIHLALNEERPVSASVDILTLINKNTNDFFDFSNFLKRYLSGRLSLRHVYAEFRAQINKFLKSGLVPTHIDSHKHIHILPGMWNATVSLAKEFGIRRIRVSKSSVGSILRFSASLRACGLFGMSVLATGYSAKIKKAGMNTPDRVFGLLESGHLNEKRLMDILNSLPDGTNELICHPGLGSEKLSKKYGWGYSWSAELAALTGKTAEDFIKKSGIELIRYDQI